MEKIKVMIVDDIQEIRDHFCKIISQEDGMEVVITANSGVSAMSALKNQIPDVILLDIQMETKTAGLDFARYAQKVFPQIKIIILTIHEEDELLFQAYNAGVMDYIMKSDSTEQVISSIRNVFQNKLMLRPDTAEKIVQEFSKLRSERNSFLFVLHFLTKLTNSEFEILKCVYEGQSYRNIAGSRYVSMSTIKTQVNSILRKFEKPRMKDIITLLDEVNFNEFVKLL